MATHRFLLLLSASFAAKIRGAKEDVASCFSNGGGCATCCPACAIHNERVVSRASESRETVREDCFGEGEDRVCHKEPERLVFDFREWNSDECVCVSTDVEMTDIELRLTDGSDCLNVRGHHLDVLARAGHDVVIVRDPRAKAAGPEQCEPTHHSDPPSRVQIDGGPGDDHVVVEGTYCHVFGNAGDDYLSVTGDKNKVQGNRGDDVLAVYGGANEATGGFGNDTLTAAGGAVVTRETPELLNPGRRVDQSPKKEPNKLLGGEATFVWTGEQKTSGLYQWRASEFDRCNDQPCVDGTYALPLHKVLEEGSPKHDEIIPHLDDVLLERPHDEIIPHL
jgi:hypothetical protein